jgi:nucleotide-binding universal stress UspA family protein
LASSIGATLTVVRVVEEMAELAGEEQYMRERARQVGGQMRFIVAPDAASAIVDELAKYPNTIAALTTHGRSAWTEAIMGSVAIRVIRESGRPVILYRALGSDPDAPQTIRTVALALDGNEFAEKIIPFAAPLAKSLGARILLLQALPPRSRIPVGQDRRDILESSYLHAKARAIKNLFGIEAEWEVLHGDPADAVCRYLNRMPETLLAITTHARKPFERLILGSVASACVRGTGIPMLIYWPLKSDEKRG